ncbi:MAG: BatD family protein [Prevotella sp.]|nr:BatD family protein [Prevotella sp.]
MKRILLIVSFFNFLIATTVAQTLTANAPQQVAVGQQFRLTYTVNTHDVSGFRVGQIPSEAFEVLMGPSTSTQSSFSIVNGHTTQSSTVTYTFVLSALKEGSFTIPAATVNAEGKQISSNSLKIQVSGTAPQGGGNYSRGRSSQQPETRSAGTPISGSDLFIKVSASKKRVVEQEPVLLTYKVYTLVSLTQLEGKMPDLKGFHTQEIALPQEKSFKVEQFNGRNYKTVTWSQYVMFPQMAGKLEVPPITFNGIVVQQNRNIDPFEAFFNGGSSYVEVKKQIQAPGVEIQVDPLPDRPMGFSGGVGRFSMKTEIDKDELKSNDPLTIRVTISGTGNLKLIKEPVIKFPKDFDTYDAKMTDKSRLTTSGLEGSIIYEYLAVPRHQGQYTIPPIEFIYYDTQDKQYKTLTSEAYQLNVAKGEGGESQVQTFTNQEDIQMLGSDIRHIKLGNANVKADGDYFFGSYLYILSISALLLIFITLFYVFRKRAIENADLGKVRGKKANKIATKRLKQAAKLMKDNKPNEFYDEALRALWGYVGDKLNIPVEQLSRENISDRLSAHQVDGDTIGQFLSAIDECEFERYAPGDPKGNMSKVYQTAITAIEKIEEGMNRKPKKTAATAILLLLLLMPSSAFALSKAEADSSYVNENYQQAIEQYERLLQAGPSAELYYNLGNSYYRMDDITHAILNYERALLLSPGDDDIRFNLQLARSKTIDKIVPQSEFFLTTWYRSIVNLLSVDGWAYIAIFCLAFTVILLIVYLFSSPVWLRKIGFFGGLLLLLCFILGNVFAWHQRRMIVHRDGAIIIQSAVPVKSTPAQNGTDLFLLHEGTKVNIIDDSMNGWYEVRVPDGKQGWVETSQIEVI